MPVRAKGWGPHSTERGGVEGQDATVAILKLLARFWGLHLLQATFRRDGNAVIEQKEPHQSPRLHAMHISLLLTQSIAIQLLW